MKKLEPRDFEKLEPKEILLKLLDNPNIPDSSKVEIKKVLDMEKDELKLYAGKQGQIWIGDREKHLMTMWRLFKWKKEDAEGKNKTVRKWVRVPLYILKSDFRGCQFAVPKYHYLKNGEIDGAIGEVKRYRLGVRKFERVKEKGYEYLKYMGEKGYVKIADETKFESDPEFDEAIGN